MTTKTDTPKTQRVFDIARRTRLRNRKAGGLSVEQRLTLLEADMARLVERLERRGIDL